MAWPVRYNMPTFDGPADMRTPQLILLLILPSAARPDVLRSQATEVTAQGPIALTLRGDTPEVSHPPATSGHRAVFALTNPGTDTTRYHLGCVGLGRVRCAGVKHREVTLVPGGSAEAVAFYEVADAGRGLLVLTARSSAPSARATARLAVRIR